MSLSVTIDQQSGFCFGVVYAIQMAEDFLENHDTLYCLGDIVHNDLEVNRLKAKGLKIIHHEDLKNLKNTSVLIRAHGEPPSTYQIALENNIELIDASCPVVLKLQNRVRNAYEGNTQIIIFGKPGHAEVNGLLGQTHNQAIVITSIEDLDSANIDYSKPIQFFSQTTKSTAKFYQIKQEIEKRSQKEFKANDTICRQVSNREPQLNKFARNFDVIIFIAGKKSSNGKVLYEVCKQANPHSYFISSVDEIQKEWFYNIKTVGICGATSTPMWQMEEAKQWIENHIAPLLSP
ncbi:MAG: 4-hydroxy-3-methylbut-2-enyl diphosphate reductase [Bacteroidia bacterium]|nr:MAG: 4-hydroxy-3-methylbut-2-enyl diphosphate reductase [Bacteroidia bacterium]